MTRAEGLDALLLAGAVEQARAVASGALTAAALRQAQRAAIDTRNPALNAFVQLAPVDGPEPPSARSVLAGSSFAAKDNIDVAGFATHAGLAALQAPAAAVDAPVVARLKQAGLHCLGKLNMHAVALGATNHNADFGHAYNPRGVGLTPGGSSGGSGAAVAAGLCGIALGTDTMGSVRVPAAYCGVVGFKPSFDRLSTEGVLPLSRLLDHVGLLARRVEDVQAAFALAASPAPCTPVLARLPCVLARPADRRALALEPAVRAAYEDALERLDALGCEWREIDLSGYDFGRVRRAGLLLCEAELLDTLAVPLAERAGQMPADLRAMLAYAARKAPVDIARALAVVMDAGKWLQRRLLDVDALVLPTTGQVAFAMDGPVPADQADFTAMANVMGAPAISLPLPVGADALPVGLQLLALRGRDEALLALAARVEALLRADALS